MRYYSDTVCCYSTGKIEEIVKLGDSIIERAVLRKLLNVTKKMTYDELKKIQLSIAFSESDDSNLGRVFDMESQEMNMNQHSRIMTPSSTNPLQRNTTNTPSLSEQDNQSSNTLM